MKGTLTQNGDTCDATPEAIQKAASGDEFFWLNLDVHDPGPDDDITELLCGTFHFHPVAVEAVEVEVYPRAKVVVNERTGTVVIGGDVRLEPGELLLRHRREEGGERVDLQVLPISDAHIAASRADRGL